MPEHLKALVVILVLAGCVFALARVPACRTAMAEADFKRRRALWLALTGIAFLAHSFWLYIGLAGVLLLAALKREKNALALFFFLLFAVPPIPAEIPGFGLINFFMEIDYLRLLALTILLPTAWSLARRDAVPFGQWPADWYLAAYLLLLFVLQLTVDSATNSLRMAFYSFLGAFLPYYVASRLPRDLDAFREALMAFVIAAMLIALIGIFEFARHWLLYAALAPALGVPWDKGEYLARGDYLRALATTGHAIALGYVMAVATGFHLFLKKSVSPFAWNWGLLLLLGGLVVPLSRGPWVGAVAMLAVFVATGPRPLQSIGMPTLLGLLAMPLLLITPWSDKVIDYLPFVGSVDAETISYRQRLLEVSLEVVADHPWFGASDFLLDPRMQSLVQGEKIIDMVNSYLGIAMASGLVGLGLAIAFFAAVLGGMRREMKRHADKDGELYLLGRTLLATLAGILVTIFTVSSIFAIPVVYWAVAGLGMAYAGLLARLRQQAARGAEARPAMAFAAK